MPNKFSLPIVLGLALYAVTAQAEPQAAAHAAACVAALKAREPVLAASLKAGAPVEPELLGVVRSGVAIVGTQYLAGVDEAEAKRLLAIAEKDFETLPTAQAQTRQTQCQQEGERLYQQASPLEQSLIVHAAQRRVKKLKSA